MENLCVDGRIIFKKRCQIGRGGGERIDLARNTDKLQALVYKVTKFQVS